VTGAALPARAGVTGAALLAREARA